MTGMPCETVQFYRRPPGLEPVSQRINIRLDGALFADTSRALRVLETHHAPTHSLCATRRYRSHPAPGSRQQLLRMGGRRALLR